MNGQRIARDWSVTSYLEILPDTFRILPDTTRILSGYFPDYFRNTTGYSPFSKNAFKLGKLSSYPLSLYNWTSLSKSSQSKEKKNSRKNPLKVNWFEKQKYKALITAPTALVRISMTCASWWLFLSYIFNYLFVQQVIITSASAPSPLRLPLLLTWRKEICTLILLVACTTLGNYTDDIYRGVPIKNSRTSVTISSPNFPKRYPRDIQCTWRIQAPDSFKVQLSFLEFQLEKQSLDLRCHDYISVRWDALLLSTDYSDGGVLEMEPLRSMIQLLNHAKCKYPACLLPVVRTLTYKNFWAVCFNSSKRGQYNGLK